SPSQEAPRCSRTPRSFPPHRTPSFFPNQSNSQSLSAAAPTQTPPAPHSAPPPRSSHTPTARSDKATASAMARTSRTSRCLQPVQNPATLRPPRLRQTRPVPAAQISILPSHRRAPPQTSPFPTDTPGKTQTRTRPGRIRRPARISPPTPLPHRAPQTPTSPGGKRQTRSALCRTRALRIPATMHTAPRRGTALPKFPAPPKSQAVSSRYFLTPSFLACPAFGPATLQFPDCTPSLLLACPSGPLTDTYGVSRVSAPSIPGIPGRRSQISDNWLLPIETPLLHRLDARPRLPPDVSNSLLRLLAPPRSARHPVLSIIATRRHPSRATFYFSCRHFGCPRHRQTPRKGNRPQRHCPPDHPPRRRSLRLRHPLPHPGIYPRPWVGPLDRSPAR